jgi:hypothetical protein
MRYADERADERRALTEVADIVSGGPYRGDQSGPGPHHPMPAAITAEDKDAYLDQDRWFGWTFNAPQYDPETGGSYHEISDDLRNRIAGDDGRAKVADKAELARAIAALGFRAEINEEETMATRITTDSDYEMGDDDRNLIIDIRGHTGPVTVTLCPDPVPLQSVEIVTGEGNPNLSTITVEGNGRLVEGQDEAQFRSLALSVTLLFMEDRWIIR